jgi:purine-binding chemotaxis protein CheW
MFFGFFMNLAEIRKKAQQEKSAAHTGPSSDRLCPATETKDLIPVSVETVTERAVSGDLGETARSAEPEKLPEVFDPLAIILAGRQAAVHHSEDVPEPAPDAAAEVGASRKYICFRVAAEQYAINLMDIKEIIKPREITEVPHAPDFVRGIISLRGVIIPVFDIRVRLGFARTTPTGKERIVIVKKKNGCCGLLVDEVFQVVTLAHQPIENPPAVLEGTDREFIGGIGRHEEHMFILMDLEKVLDVTLC